MLLVTIILNVKNKTLVIKEYVEEIKPYLKDTINSLKKSDTWKIQLRIAINFMPSKNIDKKHVMHSKSNNIEIMIGKETVNAIKECLELLFF